MLRLTVWTGAFSFCLAVWYAVFYFVKHIVFGG